jgi:hypothetical protein
VEYIARSSVAPPPPTVTTGCDDITIDELFVEVAAGDIPRAEDNWVESMPCREGNAAAPRFNDLLPLLRLENELEDTAAGEEAATCGNCKSETVCES